MGLFVLRPAAAVDLDGIWEYSVENWGVERARRYANDIRAAIERLAADPRRGRPCGEGYFRMATGSHFIIYSVRDEGVDVVRVLHQRMDLKRHLTPPPPA